MRTTVSIDDHLLMAAKERAHERHQTLGEFIEVALQRHLAVVPDEQVPELPVYDGPSRFLPGIDLRSNRSMYDAMDEGEDLVKLR